MELSTRVRNLVSSSTIQAAEKVWELTRQGDDIVRFDIGEPDFDTPDHIREAGIEAIKQS